MSEARTAQLVAEVQWLLSTAKVYRLSEPIPWTDHGEDGGATEHVVVNAVHSAWDHGGPEVMAWACDENGEFVAASGRGNPVAEIRGTSRHAAAVESQGFEMVLGPEPRQIGTTGRPPTREEIEHFNLFLEERIKELNQTLARLRQSRDRIDN